MVHAIKRVEDTACPLCGGRPKLMNSDRVRYWVACRRCQARGPERAGGVSAVKAWEGLPGHRGSQAHAWGLLVRRPAEEVFA